MSIIEKIYIKKFRGFEDVTIDFGRPVNAIIGRNGTMKTTLLGILAHPFSLETGPMSSEQPLVGGKKFNSRMSDKFKFSDEFDVAGEHEWTLTINSKVYPKKSFTCLSERRTDSNRLRFWSTEGRGKGTNYIQCPVIYLSMKRLIPIGEEKSLKVEDASLTPEEKQLYISIHNRILISTDHIEKVSSLQSPNKSTLGPVTDYSDAITISAGQDNVGRIILAVLSMKRLKEKYGKDYKGGIIFIDEVESTLYPAAQEKLLEFMHESAQKYGIQFFFTTHSMSTIRFLKAGKYHERNKTAYLQKISDKIKVYEDPSLLNIENDLNVAAGRKGVSAKIKVYCEDAVGISMAKALLPKDIKDNVTFVKGMSLSWQTYKALYTNNVPEFKTNIIVLDGDVKRKERGQGWRNFPSNKNIVALPSDMPPEQMIYEMLFNLDAGDSFWDNDLGKYTKDVCFRDHPNYTEDIDTIKKWYEEQKEFAGKGYVKFLNYWKKNNEHEVEIFVDDFIRAYNYVAEQVGDKKIII